MFEFFFGNKKKHRPLYLIDGDSVCNETWVYDDVLGTSEVVFVRMKEPTHQGPSVIRDRPEVTPVYLSTKEYRPGKEVADKFIGILLQKAVTDGYREINIVSRDADMIDTARMVINLNEFPVKTRINIIMPMLNKPAKGIDYSPSILENVEMRVYRVKPKMTKIQ